MRLLLLDLYQHSYCVLELNLCYDFEPIFVLPQVINNRLFLFLLLLLLINFICLVEWIQNISQERDFPVIFEAVLSVLRMMVTWELVTRTVRLFDILFEQLQLHSLKQDVRLNRLRCLVLDRIQLV